MKNNNTNIDDFRYSILASSILVFLVIVVGGIVRSTGASGTCPNWPMCNGSWLPPGSGSALTEYIHRLLTALLAPALLWSAFEAWRHYRRQSQVSLPVYAAIVLLCLQVITSRSLVNSSPALQPLASITHLGLSLLILALLLGSTVSAFYLGRDKLAKNPASPFARLTYITLVAVFILLATGAVVTGAGAEAFCRGWPLCSPGSWLPQDLGDWLNTIHRLAVAAAGFLIAWQAIQAWRSQRTQTSVLVASSAATVLFCAQALMGWYATIHNYPAFMHSLHEATAAAVWAALVVQAAAIKISGRSREVEMQEAASARGRSGLAKDFLMLTKPVVVLLLLVTTYTGMVIGAHAFPALGLTFWTLLGGAMAAGGSGAINQYIDRKDDSKMQRTERRPIPSGRLTPGEGLAFGVGLCLASFFLLVAFVNLLAALLSLAGMIYYVLIYSIFLKKATVQNIVIGGGAGAIPPLVGWAAATGSLNIPSLFLFAVIFMWTPPHFWSLAIVRSKDYARAGVPMLPVVRGEGQARSQILVYTIELVALTLLLPLFGLGHAIYLVAALGLGGGLLFYAWRVWRKGGNKVAWMMYRFSSMYLALLFVALMVDRLILK